MAFYSMTKVFVPASLLVTTAFAGCPAQCPFPGQLSCHNTTAVPDTCCFNAPGGQLLQTQFWDSNPASGPKDHWTIHGLWPDHCDGTYDQFCDESRQYKNITQILESYGQTELLAYMRKYYTDYHGEEEQFWEHEFGKHATCISTLNPSCYTNYSPQEEVVDFFRRVTSLFSTLDTYSFLATSGITPSSSHNYTYSAIMTALRNARGVNATVECSDGALDQVYYSFDVRGSVQTGEFVPADPIGEGTSSCPQSLMYLPKNKSSAYPVQNVSASARPTASYDVQCRFTPVPLGPPSYGGY